jgi:crotonobetainyl-CoA:carnitine CoA-transferase CaiB-like acyl-CoA transferase
MPDMPPSTPPTPSETALAALWQAAGLPAPALRMASLPGIGAVLPSSFDIATAAQASIGAAGLAAAWLWQHRSGQPQQLLMDRAHATLEFSGHFSIDGQTPELWDKLSGLYACGAALGQPGWVRVHANFAHHREAALRVLGLPEGAATERPAVTQALQKWSATAFEQAVTDAGGVVAAARSFAEWDAHPQAQALASQRLVAITPIAGGEAPPRAWPAVSATQAGAPGHRPLSGLRVLDLTRILAGPVAGRCLAGHGADVLLVNGPHLPNIAAIADTSRGKLSAQIDLRADAGCHQLHGLAQQAHVFLQGYRPGALAGRGFSATALAQRHPGIVVASLSAYGDSGPWAGRRGFDSLVQTCTGLNLAEAQAAGSPTPRAQPMQVLDYAAGHLLAFGIQAALWRQATQGGSWQVQVTLAGVGHWLRSLGQDSSGLAAVAPPATPWLEDSASGFGQGGPGRLQAMRHAAQLSATPVQWLRPSMPPGSHPAAWPPLPA